MGCAAANNAAKYNHGVESLGFNQLRGGEGEFNRARHLKGLDLRFVEAFAAKNFECAISESVGDFGIPQSGYYGHPHAVEFGQGLLQSGLNAVG